VDVQLEITVLEV
jgi:hypothetical protein